MRLTPARSLKPGTRVATASGFGVIESIEFDPERMITGGPLVKSARALKLVLRGGAVRYLHPGDEVLSDMAK
jgi:hypothetical protein